MMEDCDEPLLLRISLYLLHMKRFSRDEQLGQSTLTKKKRKKKRKTNVSARDRTGDLARVRRT